MTKYILCLGLGFALLVLSSSTAEARRGFGTTQEELEFVAATEIRDDGGNPLALCRLVETTFAMGFLPVLTNTQSYALAPNGCVTDAYFDIPTQQLVAAQQAGLIPSSVPSAPGNTDRAIWYYGLYGVVGISFLFAMIAKVRSVFGVGGRVSRKAAPKTATRMLAAMCKVAKADGEIAQGEIATITQTIRRITGRDIGAQQVINMIHETDDSSDLSELRALGDGLRPRDRMNVLEAALTVAVSDGKIDPAEYSLIRDLATALDIKADDFRITLRQVAGHLAPQSV